MDNKEWRVLISKKTGLYEAHSTYFETWYEDEMAHVKTYPLQSQFQAERIAVLLNTLEGIEQHTFIQVLRDANIWRD